MTVNECNIAQVFEFQKMMTGNWQTQIIALKEHDSAFGKLNFLQAFPAQFEVH